MQIGIPTGFTKNYAALTMLAALQQIDYPPEKLKLTFAVTMLKNHPKAQAYLDRLSALLEAAELPYKTNLIITEPTDADYYRWGAYFGVICNLHALRMEFLKSDYEYFWLLGGDNPPYKQTLRKLVALNVDVASGKIRQRPVKADDNSAPVVLWQNYWEMKDLPQTLEPILREELRKAWLDYGFLKVPDFTKVGGRIDNCLFGSGCSLIRRRVFEHVGYALGYGGIHSEDLHFGLHSRLLGFSTAMDYNADCGHYDEDGMLY